MRLTYYENGYARYDFNGVQYQNKIADRLAAYEDTGLEPEEIEAAKAALMGKSLAEIKELNGVSVEQMIELTKAEAEGRLVVLPCKVGDDVYFLHEKQIHRLRVQGISVSNSGKDTLLHFGGYPAPYVWGSGIGETYFLSREEAEAKLKEPKE